METAGAASQGRLFILVRRAGQGDRDAFKTIVRLYQKKVYLLAYSFFRNREDAMDIVQETFLRLYQKAHMFEEDKNLQNWLLQIAKNLCIDHYRKRHKKDQEFLTGQDIEVAERAVLERDEDSSLSCDLKLIFGRCLSRLTERQRMIFVMRHYNQLQYAEIAQILDIAVGTVKSLNFKAIQNLKAHLSPYLGVRP
jgi:RNA polymerase sigma-70 factor (ECF subfamily)